MPKFDNQTIELVLIALVALAMLVQAIVLLAAFIAMRKAALSIDQKLDAFSSSVMPLIDNTRALVDAPDSQNRRNRRRYRSPHSFAAGTDR